MGLSHARYPSGNRTSPLWTGHAATVTLELGGYRRFSGCVVEIQVRSILQHTWAEIEHDLGYKSALAIPKQIRRRFSRLAGLLEIADSEFVQLRDTLQTYERVVMSEVAEAPTSVAVDQASLSAYIKQSTRVQNLDRQIAQLVGARVRESISPGFIGTLATKFDNIGLRTRCPRLLYGAPTGHGKPTSFSAASKADHHENLPASRFLPTAFCPLPTALQPHPSRPVVRNPRQQRREIPGPAWQAC